MGQENRNQEKIYQDFDNIIQIENSGIIEGFEYVEIHRMINNKHKFFKTFDFVPGTVFYDGQPFFNVDLKYNVFQDILLIQIENDQGKMIFQPFDSRLDGFILQNRTFENIKAVETGPELAGIYEVLLETDGIKVLKKHRKKEKTLLDREVVYYEFSADEPHYFYWVNNKLEILNRSNLMESFPEEKSNIRNFYRSKRKEAKNNPDVFIQNLFKMLYDKLKDE
ncbi:MAG: hypothetical protein WBL21_01655 [Salinimicrobium sp.]